MRIYSSEFFYYTVLNVGRVTSWKIIEGKDREYDTFSIPKRRGGMRRIAGVKKNSNLAFLQSRLAANLLDEIPLPAAAVGYIGGKSYKNFLAPHVGADYFMKLDLKDFFPSVTQEMIEEQLEEFVEIADEAQRYEVLEAISEICTYEGSLPQGGLVSPVVSNVVMRRLDRRIELYCQKLNLTYTRYVDDLLFSSGGEFGRPLDFKGNPWLKKRIAGILREGGFRLNERKTKYGSGSISLNGIVVGGSVRFSRKRLYDIRKILFLCEDGVKRGGELGDVIVRLQSDTFRCYCPREGRDRQDISVRFREYLSGYRCYLMDWCDSDKLELHMDKTDLEHIIRRIEALLVKFDFN